MICTEIYDGQGLGNQLWCYIVTKCIAKRNNYDYSIINSKRFKCINFMNLDYGLDNNNSGSGNKPGPIEGFSYYIENYTAHPELGKKFPDKKYMSNIPITKTDYNLLNVSDNTKIDGAMQSIIYIKDDKEDIKKWLKLKTEKECYDYSNKNTCIINFRGGEYTGYPELLLNKKYWSDSIDHMKNINLNMKFVVITDDVKTAKNFFPDFLVFHFSIGKDYSIIKNSYYSIISNSSFAFFPIFTSETNIFNIVPKYGIMHNVSEDFWTLGDPIVKGWNYMSKDGILYNSKQCLIEKKEYEEKNKHFWL